VLIVAGSLTAVVGAVMCFAQDHVKRLLAFATIAYVGLFLIGLGLLTPVGLAGAAIYIVSDGLGKAGLFASVGIVQHRLRHVSEARLRGLGRDLPFTGLLFLAGALSFASLPPFGTFLGKSLIEDGLSSAGYEWVVPILVLTSVLTSAAVLRVAAGAFLGWGTAGPRRVSALDESGSEEDAPRGHTPPSMYLPALAMILGALAVGTIPGIAESVQGAAARFADGHGYAAAVLNGTTPAQPGTPPYSTAGHAYAYAAVTGLGAVAMAALALFGNRGRGSAGARLADLGERALAPLRAVHSGRVGDYVAWLVSGVAALGGALALALHPI